MNENLVRRLRRLEAEHKKEWGGATEESCLIAEAADVIEALSAQLEQKTKSAAPTRKRKKCCCGASHAYQYKKDELYYLLCHGCGKQTPLVEKSELDNAWNKIADVPVVWEKL